MSVMVFPAYAKTFDKEQEYHFKGHGLFIFGSDLNGNKISLQIYPIQDSKDVFIDLRILSSDGSYVTKCLAPKQVLKVSGTLKASAEFNTANLVCPEKQGPDTIISASIIGTGEITVNDKYDFEDCNIVEGIEKCTRDRGSITEYIGIGTISGYGLTFLEQSASIIDTKIIHTTWTNP